MPEELENINKDRDLEKVKGSFLKGFLEVLQVLVTSLVIVVLIRSYLIQPFLVKGASMEPNFHDGNYLIVDEISYRFRKPERGEVIVFKYPKDPKQYFIKRIVGLPGEKIEIKDQKVSIWNSENPNGLLLDEKYLTKEELTKGSTVLQLKPTEYFVMGDNRLFSSDSRYWGALPSDLIIGKAWVRAWPIEQAKIFGKN